MLHIQQHMLKKHESSFQLPNRLPSPNAMLRSFFTLFYLFSPFHSPPFIPLWLSRGHPQWKCSRDTAGCSLCMCVCALAEVLCLEEGVIEGGMEGTGVTKGREGHRDGNGEQTDAAQTPEGLRSHIFLASSPGDRDM